MKDYTTISVFLNYSLKELKEKYRKHLGYVKNAKVTRNDLASWLSSLVEADIDGI